MCLIVSDAAEANGFSCCLRYVFYEVATRLNRVMPLIPHSVTNNGGRLIYRADGTLRAIGEVGCTTTERNQDVDSNRKKKLGVKCHIL